MRTLIDNDNDTWHEYAPDSWGSTAVSPHVRRTLEYIRKEFGPVTISGEPDASTVEEVSGVFLVTSTDYDNRATVLLATSSEIVATGLAASLKAADVAGYYRYDVERKPVVR